MPFEGQWGGGRFLEVVNHATLVANSATLVANGAALVARSGQGGRKRVKKTIICSIMPPKWPIMPPNLLICGQ